MSVVQKVIEDDWWLLVQQVTGQTTRGSWGDSLGITIEEQLEALVGIQLESRLSIRKQ